MLWEIEAERFHGDFELVVVDVAVFVEVEEGKLGELIRIAVEVSRQTGEIGGRDSRIESSYGFVDLFPLLFTQLRELVLPRPLHALPLSAVGSLALYPLRLAVLLRRCRGAAEAGGRVERVLLCGGGCASATETGGVGPGRESRVIGRGGH